MKISIVTLKKMVHEVLKEQLARSGASYAGPRGGAADTYVGGGPAPSEAAERAELVRLGYMTPEGRLTPTGRTYVSGLIDRHARAMVERYRATGAMPSEGDASLGRLGLGGMEASAHNQAVRRAHAMIRGTGLESGAERMARRSGAAPAPAGSSLETLMSRATGGREADIASMAAGAVVPGSAARPATPSGEEVERAGRARAAEAMRALAATRADKAARRREGGWGGGAPPASTSVASVPPLPPAPSSTDPRLAALSRPPSGDPLEGILEEKNALTEMIRKAVKEALSEKKK